MMQTAKRFFLLTLWMLVALHKTYAQLPHDAGVTQILSVPVLLNEGQSMPFQVAVHNFGTDTIHMMNIEYKVNNFAPVIISWSGVLPPQMTDTVNMTAFTSPAGNSIICARTILINDTNPSNDQSCFLFYGIPHHDAAVVGVIGPNSGCGLGVDSVTIWIKNIGVNTINHPVSSGATVSYRREGQTTVVTEPFTKVLYSQDSIWHCFSTPVNYGVTTQTDTVRIVAWINLPGDNVSYNDTAFMEVISVHTPAAPVVFDTIILYGSSVTLPAVSPDPVSWYPTIVSTVALHSGSTYTTPILYSNTTYWVEAVAGLPGGPSYPQGCPGPRVPLNVIVFGSPACDVGISTLTQPVSSVLLSNQEDVTIRVSNFGTVLQQNIPVSYQIDNQPPVTEMITTIIPPGFFLYYTFTTKANLSNAGQTYQLKTWTGLPCDSFFANDTIYAAVTKLLPAYCQSSATMPTNTEITNVTGPGSLNNSSPSFGAMYTDFTTTVLPPVLSPGVSYIMNITTSFAPGAYINDSCHVKVWIDFNRDGVFDPVNELVFLHTTYSSNTVSGSYRSRQRLPVALQRCVLCIRLRPDPMLCNPAGLTHREKQKTIW
jgi:hypothetical protein